MDKTIQVFCHLCHRGVLIQKEPMYKCGKCDIEICSNCFDFETRYCKQCAQPEITAREAKTKDLVKTRKEKERSTAWAFWGGFGCLIFAAIYFLQGKTGGAIIFSILLIINIIVFFRNA